ncbi:MAG: carbamoyltransferase HypF [Verrucomicrobia bacterium]|nr:carbamoyltransferase HypF [Verrucomicrobiota bacterium]
MKLHASITVQGAVQGVGFRPFVFRLATGLGLCGGVRNGPGGVLIEAEGSEENLQRFLERLRTEAPGPARIRDVEVRFGEARGGHGFEVWESEAGARRTAWVLPDLATCPDCVRELFDPQDRRFRHPFISCAHCGPRYSIVERMPYDRAGTSMRLFPLCRDCGREYADPGDRRFHAQTIACPECGPKLVAWDAGGGQAGGDGEAIALAADVLRSGGVVALKGIGGFQLLADARSDEAVERLRRGKQRPEKPFALMVPDLAAAARLGEVGGVEAGLLASAAAPIVLLRGRRADGGWAIAAGVAPGIPWLGIMLPAAGLHHLLMAELGFPLVATSGNRLEEPIWISEAEAVSRLGAIADLFLVHDRPIVRPLDDSVVQVVAGRAQVLRLARGYAPLPVEMPGVEEDQDPVLAVGGHLKNAVAVGFGRSLHLGAHVGDLVSPEAGTSFRRAVHDLPELFGVEPERTACDLHPDYHSTLVAERLNRPLVRVPHHRAHVLACMADNGLPPPVLGVAWDGAGLGEDGVIRGGEFLLEERGNSRRVAHFHPFRLPGGEAAASRPVRSAMGVLFEAMGRDGLAWGARRGWWEEGDPWVRAWDGRASWPVTTSVGRLFDAVAALTGLRTGTGYEGQAAMELENAAPGFREAGCYPHDLPMPVVDWRPMIREIAAEAAAGVAPGLISARFHNTLARMIVGVAQSVGCTVVALTGGCFQNRLLTERCVEGLSGAGFRPVWHHRIPPNDGGLAAGQIMGSVT